MAIRAIIGFDDLVCPAAAQTVAQPMPGLPPFNQVPGGSALYGGPVITKTSDGWCKLYMNKGPDGSGIGKSNQIWANLKDFGITATPTTNFTIGFRFAIPTTSYASIHGVYIAETLAVTNTAAGLFPSTAIPGYVLGTEYYLEFTVDVATGVVKRWVDGTPIADTTITAAAIAAIKAGTAFFCLGWYQSGLIAQNLEFSWRFKDMYVLEKTPDGINSGRLGPQTVVPIDLLSVTAPWTTPTGTVVDALNAPITDTASSLTPIVSSDAVATQAALVLKTGSLLGPVNGVVLTASGRRAAGSSANLKSSVSQGATNTADKTLTLTTSFQYGLPVQIFDVAPDGTTWSKAKIEACTLKLTPA